MNLDAINPKLRQRVSDAIVRESEARRALHHVDPERSGGAVWVDPAENAGGAAQKPKRGRATPRLGRWSTQDSWQHPFTSECIMATLPYGPSVNEAWSNVMIKGKSRRVLTRKAREFKKRVAAICAALKPLDGPLGLRLAVYRPMRRGDVSNKVKLTEDALIGFAYHDDEQIVHVEADRFEDRENPRIQVWVWKISTGPKP